MSKFEISTVSTSETDSTEGLISSIDSFVIKSTVNLPSKLSDSISSDEGFEYIISPASSKFLNTINALADFSMHFSSSDTEIL